MRPVAPLVSPKWLLLLACVALPACAVTTSHPRSADVDYSDAQHYDKPHAPSPDYRRDDADPDEAHVPKRVYRVRDRRTRRTTRVEIVPTDAE